MIVDAKEILQDPVCVDDVVKPDVQIEIKNYIFPTKKSILHIKLSLRAKLAPYSFKKGKVMVNGLSLGVVQHRVCGFN